MTQQELTEHIRAYIKAAGNERDTETNIATAQAIAHIEALVYWVRDRNLTFLERNVYVEIAKIKDVEEEVE